MTRDAITLNQLEYRSLDPILTLPLAKVSRIDLSIGRNKLVVGASVATGAALGAIIFPALADKPVSCQLGYVDDPDCSPETTDAVIGLATGAIGGFLFSQLIAKERWLRVRMDLLLLDGSARFHSRVSVSTPHVF